MLKSVSKDCVDFYSLTAEEDREWSVQWHNFTSKKTERRKRSLRETTEKRERRSLTLILRSQKHFLKDAKITFNNHGILLNIESLYPNGVVTTNEKWWKFYGASNMNGFPFWGHFSVYGGGGYSAPFKTDVLSSFKVSASLANYNWIDRYSRGVFVEFSVYNPDTNIFATSFMVFEIHPTGALRTENGVKTFSIYRYHGKNQSAIIAGEIITVLFLFYFIYTELRQMIRDRGNYFKSVFNWVDVFIIVFTFTGIMLWLGRWYQEDKVLLAYKENRDKYHSFPYAAAANELFLYLVSLIVYLCIMRMMKIINTLPVVVLFLGVLKKSRGKLLSFLFSFMVLFLAFAQLAYIFLNSNPFFSSFVRTIISLFLTALGGPIYYQMKDANPIVGPLLYTSFSLLTVMIFLNLLISIINDAIKDETGNFASSVDDLEFIEYFFGKINSVIGIEIVNVSELAKMRQKEELKFARTQRLQQKRKRTRAENLRRFQAEQEAYLLMDKMLKNTEKTIDRICIEIEKYIHT